MLDKKKIATELGVTPRTIDRYRKLGMPCTLMPTGIVRFDLTEVKKWLEDEKEK